MTTLVNKHGKTPYDLAVEFYTNTKQAKASTDSAVAEQYLKLFDSFYVNEVKKTNLDKYEQLVTTCGMHTNVREIPFMTRLKPNISPYLLAWIGVCSEGNPQYLTTVLGLYSLYFYHDHPRDEELTLGWVYKNIGGGKIFDIMGIYPYYAMSKMKNEVSFFDVLKEEDLYTYQG